MMTKVSFLDLFVSFILNLVKIEAIPGVLSIGPAHFWQQTTNFIVGTIHVSITSDANQQEIQKQITDILQKFDVTHVTVQATKQPGTSMLHQTPSVSASFLNFGNHKALDRPEPTSQLPKQEHNLQQPTQGETPSEVDIETTLI